jgi:hypothetical protein
MTDLIQRLRAATGPDRELDAEICRRLGYEVRTDGGRGHYYEPKKNWSWENVPAYTASLDAAMTLVPDETMASVGRWKHCEAGTWHWSAQILPVCRIVESHERHQAEAPTPALALTIAALLARGIK